MEDPPEEHVSWLAQRHRSPRPSGMGTRITKEFRGGSLWRPRVMGGEVVTEPGTAASMGRMRMCR